MATASYLQNCSYTSVLPHTTPYELWTGIKTDLNNLRIFGCCTYAHIPDTHRKKPDVKTLKCIFIGYGTLTGIKGYRLYHPATRRLFTSRDVVFSEDLLLTSGGSPSPGNQSGHLTILMFFVQFLNLVQGCHHPMIPFL